MTRQSSTCLATAGHVRGVRPQWAERVHPRRIVRPRVGPCHDERLATVTAFTPAFAAFAHAERSWQAAPRAFCNPLTPQSLSRQWLSSGLCCDYGPCTLRALQSVAAGDKVPNRSHTLRTGAALCSLRGMAEVSLASTRSLPAVDSSRTLLPPSRPWCRLMTRRSGSFKSPV